MDLLNSFIVLIVFAAFVLSVLGLKMIVPKFVFFMKTATTKFWSYSEMRLMVAACGVILFASLLLPKVIKIEIEHNHNGNIALSAKYSDRLQLEIHNRPY